MALINTIEEVREHGVKVLFINQESSLADITGAEERFLLPVLGQELYETVLTKAASEEPDEAFVRLIQLCKRVVAPLAYWMDLPFIQTNISDKGVGNFSSDNMEAAHRWEYEELREALADKGCYALETLLQHLYSKKTEYDWKVPEQHKGIFLTGKEFTTYFPVFQPYRTFEMLRPLVNQITDQYINPTIGEDFLAELMAISSPDDDEKKAIALIKKATANLTIKTAVEVLPVRISVHGFTVLLSDANDKTTAGEKQAGETQMNILHQSAEKSGETYLMQLKEYLNKTATDNIFKTFKDSTYYQPAQVEAIPFNATAKIFTL